MNITLAVLAQGLPKYPGLTASLSLPVTLHLLNKYPVYDEPGERAAVIYPWI